MRRAALPAGALVLAIGTLLPLLPLLVWAVSGRWRYPALVPQRLDGRGLRLLADPASGVLAGLGTSALIGVAVTALALGIGVPAGRALGSYAFRGRRAVRALLLAPAVVPALAVLLGTRVVFLRYGLADSVPGVVLAQLVPALPYVVLLASGAFANLDPDYERQARALGAGPLRAFATVALPAVAPSLAVAAYVAFLVSWSDYVLALLVGGGAVQTLPLQLLGYLQGADSTRAAAVGLVLAGPPLLLAALAAPVLARVLPRGGGPTLGLARL